MDIQSREKWVEFSKAKDEMFIAHRHQASAVVRRRGRRQAACPPELHRPPALVVPYKDVLDAPVKLPPRPPESDYERPPRDLFRYVPDHAGTLIS